MGKTLRLRGGKDGGWRKRIIQGQKVHRGCPGREREGRRCVVERERLKEKKSQIIWCFFAVLCNFG